MPKILSSEEREALLASMDFVSASSAQMTDEMLRLAQDLSRIHGKIRVAKEASGIHFYMASPHGLEEDGAIELEKMHLAVNVVKYFVEEDDNCGLCMKYEKPYRVSDLVSMQPLDKRGFELKPEVLQVSAVREDYLEPDAFGNMVPKSLHLGTTPEA